MRLRCAGDVSVRLASPGPRALWCLRCLYRSCARDSSLLMRLHPQARGNSSRTYSGTVIFEINDAEDAGIIQKRIWRMTCWVFVTAQLDNSKINGAVDLDRLRISDCRNE